MYFYKNTFKMNTLNNLKNNLISRIVATENEKLLNVIISIFEVSKSEEKTTFSSEQLEMLKMSEEDIKYGRLYSEEEVDKLDAEWMN
ncbi:hypothetical protein LPB03_08080 [Polaribacter vadi]|uniref:Uncharacterized protein n=2 Tax=Polaribacter vadi TaxID=1774273 RepID=A0A1B8U2M4_9FLAO|nr:hypothetical protein LPB03_08080 [Polaribacter vadi]OBY66115.1 hypothetical protein LPB3_01465 [Polaribacter vadi]